MWLNPGRDYSVSTKIQGFPTAQQRLGRQKAAEGPHIEFRCAAIQLIFTAQNCQLKPSGLDSENALTCSLAMGGTSHDEGRMLF